jgi:hypothetical protein
VADILKNNSLRANRPPKLRKLAENRKSYDKALTRLTPEVREELHRRAAITSAPDGYANGSRLRDRVKGGSVSNPTEDAARARIEGRGDQDPQLEAKREIERRLRSAEQAAGVAVDSGWGAVLQAAANVITGPFDPDTGTWPREQHPDRVDKFLAALTKAGYLGPEGGLKPFVDRIREAGSSGVEIEIQLNRIWKETGQKIG